MSDASKKDYVDKLEAKLKEWSADIKKLKDAAEVSEAMIKKEYYKVIEDLHAKREDLKKRLQQLKEESGAVWDELKYGTENAWKEMKDAVEKALSKLKHQ